MAASFVVASELSERPCSMLVEECFAPPSATPDRLHRRGRRRARAVGAGGQVSRAQVLNGRRC